MTLRVEGPVIAGIYGLFNAADWLRYVRFAFNHNYNQTSREAVYGWFGKWLLKHPESAPLKEAACAKEPDRELRVWPDGKPPADALSEADFTRSLIKMDETQLERMRPRDRESLEQFKKVMWPAWKHTLQVAIPEGDLVVEAGEVGKVEDCTVSRLAVGRVGKGDRLPVLMLTPSRDTLRTLVAAPAEDAVAADGDALDLNNDTALLSADLFAPGLRKIGVFAGAAALAAPHPLLVHHTGKGFPFAFLRDAYAALQADKML